MHVALYVSKQIQDLGIWSMVIWSGPSKWCFLATTARVLSPH